MSATVLIADDAEFMRMMLKDIVEDMGLVVVGEACDGEQAVDLFLKTKPDLVLLDITMPKIDGNEALCSIMKNAPSAIVVMITALGQKEQVLSAIKNGARDFIIKPFDHERVQDTLNHVLTVTPV